MAYLDNNATTMLDERVLAAMMPFLSGPFANPSSVHRYGKPARAAIDIARQQVAALVGAQADEVVFTSGGTEANNLAIQGIAKANPRGRIVASAIEHPCVLEPLQALAKSGYSVGFAKVDADGYLDLEQLERQLVEAPTTLVSLMWANNETGALQPIEAVSKLIRAHGGLLHSDAVQAAGKVPVDFSVVDLMTLSAHKIYGPKGAGALLVKKSAYIEPLVTGGGQEDGLRAGTENVAAIVGFGVAAELALAEREQRASHMLAMKARFESGLAQWSDIPIYSQAVKRLPNTVQFSVPGFDGETLLMLLDQKGAAVSSGSACHSGKAEASHVLSAMGIADEIARCAVRVSVGKDTTEADVDQCLTAIAQLRG